MKKTILLPFLIFLITTSCNKEKDKHLIDVGPFSIIVPSDFVYKKGFGLDSFGGMITNGKSIFEFEFGMYGSTGEITREQFIKNYSNNLDDDGLHQLMRLINLDSFKYENGKINKLKIRNKIKKLSLNKMSDKVKLSIYENKKCSYYYSFKFENNTYNIPFFKYDKKNDYFKYYKIKTDTIDNSRRTISIWTNKENHRKSSLYIVSLDKEARNGLSIGISSASKLGKEQIIEIFNSIRLKNN
ncbi:hypothetical protein [Kordia sp.]|uniref:hypothetical protein n=1 Tax=Kordia sp. TaxID=1965332 RepID=UPI003B5BC8AF